ncbi:hypothetical protein R3P38DRAFT_1723460 [Favolaschia claudopus]|uniref:Uncharacterized protein n=1 Tax=Favolaschia claudopus TaxID=2862362 RepID=A0AAW0A9X1_9AGAR
MLASTLFAVLALGLPSLLSATPVAVEDITAVEDVAVEGLAAAATVDFINPTDNGGSWLDKSNGLGEPLNVVISAKSTPDVLTLDGLLRYAHAIGFDKECLGQHQGDPQTANLGDGRGDVNETEVLRENFGIGGTIGTCLESLEGGNHFRVFPQSTTGAIFLAVSQEEDLSEHHTIAPNGYNIGRDLLVAGAVGTKSHFNIKTFHLDTYVTVATNLTGLATAGSVGINHGIAIDGIVTLLTITKTT